MDDFLVAELEREERRERDGVAAEGAVRRRWRPEAREARSGMKVGETSAADGLVFWALPDWVPDWWAEGDPK